MSKKELALYENYALKRLRKPIVLKVIDIQNSKKNYEWWKV